MINSVWLSPPEDSSVQLSILMRIGLTKYSSSWHPITRSLQSKELLCPSRRSAFKTWQKYGRFGESIRFRFIQCMHLRWYTFFYKKKKKSGSLYTIFTVFVLINDPQKQTVPYIAARLRHSATVTGLDLKWWLLQFLQVGCHSDPLPAFIFTTNESLRSQWSPGSRRARQLLSCCLSGWHNVTVEKHGYTSFLSVRGCVCVGVWVLHVGSAVIHWIWSRHIS